ncbi:putative superoxide reductase [Geobacter sp. OR-1]|uniref:class II SORL domain-containing protein n=1 Tax=Geobacter sp. OR-1 TaxID=1266765 RepID=UPI0005444080|nr:class II SORL domain-containing protein [Geobacter sp. OR-1]GAM09357.1 putative superoxide reductase [Geobacter sp. OR-1]
MNRRMFLQSALTGAVVAVSYRTAAAISYFPTKVDQALFQNINRVKDPAAKTPLEKGHAPVIIAPASVKAGDLFTVEVSVGETLHPMGPAHWIQYIELSIGNEPAGRIDLQPKGYMKPKAAFTLAIPKESATEGKITLVARQHCNLHGLWEGNFDITVT